MRFAVSRPARSVMLLLLLLLLARIASMSLLPLMDTTEARYAEIGRRMAESGDWITPWHDGGGPFWGKPPLSFWFTAASMKLFGVHEFAARLPHFLCAAGVAAFTWRVAVFRPRDEALMALALLGGSALFYVSSGAVMTDGVLLLGTTLAIYGFWIGLHGAQAPRQRQRWLLFVGIAIGLLAKGPVAAVLIGVPLLTWIVIRGEAWATWCAFPWILGSALIALLVLPWYVLAEIRTPGFLRYFLVGEHWHRFLTPGWKGDLYGTAHRYPPGTIWIFAFGALLPWSVLLPAFALYRRFSRHAEGPPMQDRAWSQYLVLWGLTPLLFFTASRNIIWTYVLPGLPALALLAAQWLMKSPGASPRRVVIAGLSISLASWTAFAVYLEASGLAERRSAKALVAAYEAQRTGDDLLVYVGVRPHSAAFYSAGRARRAENAAELAKQLPPDGSFVAIRSEEAQTLSALAGVRTKTIGRFGAHELLRVYARPQAPVAHTNTS